MISDRKKQIKRFYKTVVSGYRFLKTSWSVQTKVFFEQSTLHGVRYIAEQGRPFIEKLMWLICVNIGAVTTIVIIINLWEKFQTNPTITGLDTDFHNWDVQFPSIILCQENPGNVTLIDEYMNENIKTMALTGEEDVRKFFMDLSRLSIDTLEEFTKSEAYITSEEILAENTDLRKLVALNFVNRCEGIFKQCEFKSNKRDCCDDFFLPLFTEMGFCYSFNSKNYESEIPKGNTTIPSPQVEMELIKETDIKWSIKITVNDVMFTSNKNMPLYILSWDDFIESMIEPQHVWDFLVEKILFSMKQTYTTDEARQLSIKQRRCVFPNEISLKTSPDVYTHTSCNLQCKIDNAMEYCQCIPHFYPKLPGYRHCYIKELICIAKNMQKIINVKKCNCELGCGNTVYEVDKLNQAGEREMTSTIELSFVSWPMVRYKREVLFGWVDLLVSFGGIAGLFLGFSLLSGVEIIYYFTIRAVCMILKEKDELERIQHERCANKVTDYDLSLVPYFISKPLPGNGLAEVSRRLRKNQSVYKHNKIIPVKEAKLKLIESPLPPFGIEYLN